MGATPGSPAAGTEYMVLELVSDGDGRSWTELGTATATLRGEAVKRVVGKREGTFKAVALRSWRGATNLSVERIERVQAEDIDL